MPFSSDPWAQESPSRLDPAGERVLRALAGKGPMTAGELRRRAGNLPPADLARLLAFLQSKGLVEMIPPSGRARVSRYLLTSAGEAVAPRWQAKRPSRTSFAQQVERLEERVAALEARITSLLEDRVIPAIAALRAELTAWLAEFQAAGTRSTQREGAGIVDYQEFRTMATQAYYRLDREIKGHGLVPIPALRDALSGSVAGEDFDRYLLRLFQEGAVDLISHDNPASLPAEQARKCIRHPVAGLLYLVRWKEK